MDTGITRIYQRYPCGRATTWELDPTGGIREMVEHKIIKQKDKHERDCDDCSPPSAMIL